MASDQHESPTPSLSEPTPLNVDELVARLRAKVEERRQSGEYPPGLEHDLDAHLRRVAAHRADGYTDELRARLAHLERGVGFDPGRISYDSRVPGGKLLHKSIGKVVSRQTQGIFEQVQELTDAVRESVRAIADALEDPRGHKHHDLAGQLDAIFERLAAYEREPADTSSAVADLRRRLDALEETERRRSFTPSYTNERFEAEFRGDEQEMLDRYRDLVKRFDGCSPVVDIGCGRGEFLTLLAELGVEATGVEIDPVLAEQCRESGQEVDVADGVRWLEGAVDRSLGGIALIQVVEHMSPQEVVDLVALSARKLRSGGRIVIETVNPQSLYVFAHAFYVDPTHGSPVHPAYLSFLLSEAGFAEVAIDWRSPPPAGEVLEESGLEESGDATPLSQTVDANVRRLNQILFAPQDYAVVGTR